MSAVLNGYALSQPTASSWTYRSVTSAMPLVAGETFYLDPSLFPVAARTYLAAMASTLSSAPVTPQQYTMATVPSAASNQFTTVVITDTPQGMANVYSDGMNWRRFSDDSIVV